jgi:LuxR family transcriptional regulator, maltose regulon positive regulatory protein
VSDSLLATKVHIPPLHGNLINRANLVVRLNEGIAQGCRLTLISAPAGYGKSTLLSEWQAQTDIPVAWLSLEKGENTPARFWSYFVAALNTLPQVRRANIGPAILQALRTPQPGLLEAPLTELVNRLSALEERVCLVLDDLHTLSESQIHQDLIYLVEHLPRSARGLHLLAASRMEPPWPLARWRARGELNELRAIDLRFSAAETGQFLQRALPLKLSPPEIAALQDRTEGWIAGLQMAAISMHGRLKAQGPAGVSYFIETFSGSNRFILDYLLDEVIGQQSEDRRAFLYETSILDRLTAPLCEALSDRPGSQALLEQLERANLFLIPLDEERRWYRYHHLFAGLLRKQLKQFWPELIPRLHQRASAWYAEHNMLAEAIHHALAAGDIAQVNQILAGNVLALVEDVELFDVLRHFKELPGQQISANPWLCVAYAWAKAYVDPSIGMNDLLQQAEQCLQSVAEDSERDHLTSHLAAIRAYLAWMKGEADQALEFAQRALENLPEDDWAARTHLLNIQGLALQYQDDLPGAAQSLKAALASAQKIGRVHETLYTTANLAFVYLLQCRLRDAFALCQAALSRIAESGQSASRMPVLAHAHATQSLILLEWHELESAVASARQGVALAEQWRQADARHFALTCLAQALGAAGELAEALAVNQRAMHLARDISPWYAQISAETEIALLLTKGDVLAAAEKFRAYEPIVAGSKGRKPLFIAASLLLAQNRFLDVVNLLEEPLAEMRQKGGRWSWLRLLLIQAVAWQSLGREAEALAVLEQCLATAEPEGYVRIFVERGAPLAALLQLARERGIKTDYISRLLAAFDMPEESPTSRTPFAPASAPPDANLIEPLSARELEVLRFLNSPLAIPDIAREMLIAPSTLRTHVRNIYLKLDVHGRFEALQRARDLGLF